MGSPVRENHRGATETPTKSVYRLDLRGLSREQMAGKGKAINKATVELSDFPSKGV